MADRVCVPERNLHAIPDAIDDGEAVFIEPLAAAFRIAEQVSDRSVDSPDGRRRRQARDSSAPGSPAGSGPRSASSASIPRSWRWRGEGIRPILLAEAGSIARSQDVVVDCTGSTTGLATALGLVRPCGTVVLKTTVAGEHATSLAPIVIDEVRVIGSRCGPFPRRSPRSQSRAIDVRPLIGAEFPLDRAEEAFHAAAARGARKVLIWT